MAVLTWRNVEAPSFRDSADGIRIAGAMFDRAAGNISQGFGQFQDWRQNQTAGALLNNAQGFTDPEELRKAIASGAIFNGIDRSLVTPKALAALNVQTGSLLDQGVKAQGLNFSKENDPLRIELAKLTNAGKNAENEHNILNYPLERTRTGALTASAEANTAQTKQTTAQTKQTTDQSAQKFIIDLQNAKVELDKKVWGFNTQKTELADNNAAAALAAEASVNSMTAQDIPYYFASPQFQNLSPSAKFKAIGFLQPRFPGVDLLGVAGVGSLPVAAGSAPTTVAPTTVGAATVGAATPYSASVPTGSAPATTEGNSTGYTPSPFVTGLPFKETRDYVQNILSNTGNLTGLSVYEQAKRIMPNLISKESGGDPNAVNKKTDTDQPTGLTQIKPSTFDEMAKNYNIKGPITDRDSNVKAGEMYLKELLTKYNGDPEKALAAYNMGMGKLKTHLDNTGNSDSTSNTINPATEIAKLNAAINNSSLAAKISENELNQLNSQNNAVSYIEKYAREIADIKMDEAGAVARLQKNSALASTPYATIQNSLRLIMQQKGPGGNGNINAATAAAIIEDSIVAPDAFSRNSIFWTGGTINDKAAAEKAKFIGQGGGSDAVMRNMLVKSLSEKLTAARSNLTTASSQLTAALKRVPALSSNTIRRYRAAFDLAQATLNKILKTQQGDRDKPDNDPVNMYRPTRSWKPVTPPEDPIDQLRRGVLPRVKVE